MNSILALLYSIFLFLILLILVIYIVIQIRTTQLVEGEIKRLQNHVQQPQTNYTCEDLYSLGQLYLRKNLFNKAVLVFHQALSIWDINDKIGLGNLVNIIGFTYNKLQKYAFAIYYYKIALTILPDYVLALNNLAFTYQSLNLFKEASSCYKNCLKFQPKNRFFLSKIKIINQKILLKS
uniref:hypothetical protein n=1 Tax=Dictyotopsis propagulifera TaxID=670095 RepID=UPI002E7887CD|nr:hypothetical protein V2485_pgp022 [Dictyotopsis propagulifera]WAM63235.1 hypothetical protein [Dictyotopsis propagulifera]